MKFLRAQIRHSLTFIPQRLPWLSGSLMKTSPKTEAGTGGREEDRYRAGPRRGPCLHHALNPRSTKLQPEDGALQSSLGYGARRTLSKRVERRKEKKGICDAKEGGAGLRPYRV